MRVRLASIILVWVCAVTCRAETRAEWLEKAQQELRAAIGQKQNTNVARNVILFLGDGMGPSTVTAGRIYRGQLNKKSGEETLLSFERFPDIALSKTYNNDRQTSDSAGAATAFMCGVKANMGTVGVDSSVTYGNCSAQEAGKVTSILKWSRDEGKSVGIVTNTRVTHATPSAAYAHSSNREWESDVRMVNVTGGCKDIAQQLVDNLDIQVILGGGRRYFYTNKVPDPVTGKIGSKHRKDGRDLIKDWKEAEAKKGKISEYVFKKSQFDAINPLKTDYLLGLFAESHMKYEIERDNSGNGEPSLADMTKKAIEILQKNKKGYFLYVESGRIDHGHHDNLAKRALHEMVALDDAVLAAMELTNQKDTLIVVTADHSHPFNIVGYPYRGHDILDLVDPLTEWYEPADNLPYTTLVYANGPGPGRINLTGVDTRDVNYQQSNAVPIPYETHSGEDVAIYARGPMSHLFYGVHEQNYIAHAMAYASCVGVNKNHCAAKDTSGSGAPVTDLIVVILLLFVGFS